VCSSRLSIVEIVKRLLIVGAGGLGREVGNWAIDAINESSGWIITGFLDDNPNALYGKTTSIPLIGSVAGFVPSNGVYVVIAMGNPAVRRKLHEELLVKGAQFANVIHPTAIVAEGARLGVGVVAAPFSILSADSCIGDGVVVNYHAVIQHDAEVGRWSYISSHGNVGGGASLGQEAVVGTHSVVPPCAHVPDHYMVSPGTVFEPHNLL
jgi:sugar O-acyltransferase (sialic acid O-acetyltransferase NeuD family)